MQNKPIFGDAIAHLEKCIANTADKDKIERLKKRRDNIKAIEFYEPEPLLVREFSITDIRKGLGNSIQTPALYVIEVEDQDEETRQDVATQLWVSFNAAYADEKGKAYTKEERGYNLPPPNENNKNDRTTVLYVGKSEKNIRGRLTEHLWKVGGKTSSLQLSRWVPDIDGTLRVTVQTIRGKSASMPIEDVKDALKDLEEALQRRLRPMFGE